MNTHIDTLTAWWENAEESDDFYPGDTWIKRTQAQTGGYVYDVGRVTSKKRYYEARVLARAPKPKPAWHNAPVVSAATKEHPEFRDIWVSDCGEWRNVDGNFIDADEFLDVTPLIEAKVTDEMVERLESRFNKAAMASLPTGLARRMLTVALGLETE